VSRSGHFKGDVDVIGAHQCRIPVFLQCFGEKNARRYYFLDG
jgi:hypothetical protein